MYMQMSILSLQSLCVPVEETNQEDAPERIILEHAHTCQVCEGQVQDGPDKDHNGGENEPHTFAPIFHFLRLESEVGKGTNVCVSELETEQNETRAPHVEVVAVKFSIRVVMACFILTQAEKCFKVVLISNRV